MTPLFVRGIGFWAPGVGDWVAAQSILREKAPWPKPGTAGRPATGLMPANERRRAPDSVLLALAVAQQACSGADLDPATLPSVFVSMYGDLAINDYMCTILRDDPASMSPTRFHNSVHNAPSGYWSIATGAHAAATSVAAAEASFAAGLFEATVQAAEAGTPILLAAYDVAAIGPMRSVAASLCPFGCALVLDPAVAASGPSLELELVAAAAAAAAEPTTWARTDPDPLAEANPIAATALPLLRALAQAQPPITPLRLPLSSGLDLAVRVRP